MSNENRAVVAINQEQALTGAPERLNREFEGVLARETIERFLNSSYEEFAERVTVPTYLQVLTEKFARKRLRALAKVDGKATPGAPAVLFLCVLNAGRSQVVLDSFQHDASGRSVVRSGGSEPGARVNPVAIEVLVEKSIDISREYPKPSTDEIVRAADVAVTMGCGDKCPYFLGERYEDRVLEVPADVGAASAR